jgi:hypothetical protein
MTADDPARRLQVTEAKMATMVIRHAVADYGSWRAVYDEVAPLRERHGCIAERVLRDADDPETLLVLHDFPTLDGARTFSADPGLKAAMQRAGVAGPPRIEFYAE